MIHKVILALLLLVAGALGVAMWRVELNRPPNLREILEGLRNDKVNLQIENHWRNEMSSITTPVVGETSGRTHMVTTTRLPDESVASWKARHQEAIELARSM